MTIDLHTHFIPPGLADAFRERTEAPFIESDGTGGERLVMPVGTLPFDDAYMDMEARIAFMDGLGIARQVLSLPGLFGLDSRPAAEALPLLRLFNEEAARHAADHPDRFSAIAALPFDDLDAAVTEFRRARTELGHIGAILPNNFFLSLDWMEKLRPIFDAAEALGGHLFVHPGRRPDQANDMEGAGAPPDTMMPRRQLALQHQVANAMASLIYGDLLDGYSNFSLHVANIGGTLPLVAERIDQTAALRAPGDEVPHDRLRRVHVDCSSMGPRAIEAAVAFYGADRIVFGSDCPIYRSDWTLQAVRDARIDDTEKTAILSGTAETMLDGLI